MEWSREQEGALSAVQQWFRQGGHQPFYLAGYAGTGKTTLARHFAESVGGEVKFGAFTGKAASVLRKKGCPGATTIHSLIYKPVGNSNGKKIAELETLIEQMATLPEDKQDQALLRSWGQELQALKAKSSAMFEVNEDAEITEADLVILDECSMIDQRMGADLQKFGVPILYLGDPGQLPPVGGKGLLTDKRPDFVLEEIHRQARDSAIIWAAHEIRHGRKIGLGSFGNGEVEVLRKAEFDWELAIAADQILCGMNGTRRKLNKAARNKLGRNKLYPVEGDKLICLQNDHEEGCSTVSLAPPSARARSAVM
jgi:exodeoxyribonuclease-5